MIRRKTSNYTQNQEALHQASFTAMKGVDCSKAPTSEDTVLLAKNLDVDYDGGLVLRKPLLINNSESSNCITTGYAYQNFIKLSFYNENDNQFIKIQDMRDGTVKDCLFRVTDIYGNTYTTDGLPTYNDGVFQNVKGVKFINTPTSTIVYNASVNLKNTASYIKNRLNIYPVLLPKFGDYTTPDEEKPLKQYRLFKLYEERYQGSYVFILEMLTPEVTTLTNSEIPADFNTANFYPLALIDNYKATQTSITGILAYAIGESYSTAHIDELTESSDYAILDSINTDSTYKVVLKAFLNKPNVFKTGEAITLDNATIAIQWSSSYNGFDWTAINSEDWDNKVIVKTIDDSISSDLKDEESVVWKLEDYYVLKLPSYENVESETYAKLGEDTATSTSFFINKRVDCCILDPISDPDCFFKMYKCTLVKLKNKASDDADVVDKRLDFIISEVVFNFKKGNFETVHNDFKNPMTSNFICWNHAIYSYGGVLDSTVYVSNTDSAVFPISRIIDLGTYQSSPVYKLVPWRDYLLAFTENSVHLIQEQDVGFTTKVVNTAIGIPEQDANTCVSILNGVLFKSGSKIYTLIPNYSSGDETILNVAEVSKPIEHILESVTYHGVYKPFAFTTSENYYLFIPNGVQGKTTTHCLKYDYSRKLWTYYEYPVLIFKHEMLNVSDVRLFAIVNDTIVEYYFEKEPEDVSDTQYYGDYLTTEKVDPDLEDGVDNEEYQVTPIEFSLDSGQKTDNISLTKQFVESKIIVATLSNKDNFSMDVRIDIEGNTFKRHVDLNTDGALLRGSADDVLTLGSNTDFTENQDTFNAMRQMFLRYAGKGKTIRHIISGQSLYKFKIYETFYRYKILNVKQ